ncbi:MAG: hypothetical protein ABSG63_13810 [Spirochaetia bacterium]|jgi:hypothetical protein
MPRVLRNVSFLPLHALAVLLLLMGSAVQAAAVQAAAAPAENDLYAEAESRYLGKNYTAALDAYEQFVADYPRSERIADVQYPRAVCLYRLDHGCRHHPSGGSSPTACFESLRACSLGPSNTHCEGYI